MPFCANSSWNVTGVFYTDISNECALFDFSVYTVAVGMMCVLGVIGNIVSFIVLLQDVTRSPTTFLLQALAVADTLVLLTAIPLYMLSPIYKYTGYMKGYYDMHIRIMPFLWPIYLIPYTGTIFLTVLVSLNRYEAVCRPFKSAKQRNRSMVKRQVIFIAIISLVYNIPRFFEYQKELKCLGYNSTTEVFEMSSFGGNRVYRILYANILYFIVMHGGPLLSLAFLNVNLIRALKVQARKRTEMKKAGYQQDITLVLIVVVFVFISCQTPTFVDHILWTFLDESARQCGRWHYYYTAIGDMLAIFNSSVNFVIYVLTSPKFRQNLRIMCGVCLPSAPTTDIVLVPRGHCRKDKTMLLEENNDIGETV